MMNKEERRKFIMQDLENKMKWLEENTNHNVIYLALQGSQNYEMDVYSDEYKSDIDVKAIIIPSFEDILKGKAFYSHTYIMEDNSHIDVKDIRFYISLWEKANPSYLEILFTEFYILKNDKFKQILEMADDIAEANIDRLLSCIKGMQYEKYKALKHPYPTIKDKIERYGYDPKQFHHIYRLYCVASLICQCYKSFRETLVFEDRCDKAICLNRKTKIYHIEYVEKQAEFCVEETKNTIDEFKATHELKANKEVYEKMKAIIYGIVKDECEQSLSEKATPKKPKLIEYCDGFFKCPKCNGLIRFCQNYCDCCGQALDWSEDDE